ncbi:M48 family metalloprotease [Psychrobium sp. 1_MG-2023]|uniref:beta-barrel assembly-enhancing protease n=1 Tax=Psychrobium sp. 1_MG-2023 TaxID=3062624 RepID=UPI000C328EF8|nr:M48 family metalloprotease [Psychrobium sp. 1_MG-2023]MDP2560293.1 M48 family metalloprotease [Psychrobium sp. 1_MG-2023]PKF55410.1 peptidase M48 [Alteromonadales bacterium alter-6D02]
MKRLNKSLISLLIGAAIASQASVAAPINNNISNKLPELGTAAASTLSIEKEIRVGNAYMMMMRGKLPIVHDPLIDEYINDIGLKLVSQANDVKTPFNFFMVQNNAINAFAFFGGNVGIHTGLLLLADNESELASVLSHEITHVTQRHLARSIEERAKNSPATMAALLGSLALVMAGAGDAGIAGVQASLAMSQQLSINYTRSNEREADRIGIELMARSNFNPNSASSFFSKMAQQYRYSSKIPPMLRSHPVTEQRISETRVRAQGYNPVRVAQSLSFHLAKARILVRFTAKDETIIEDELNRMDTKTSPTLLAAQQYGKALLLLKQNKVEQSLAIIKKLRASDNANLFYIDTLSDIYLALGQPQKAAEVLAFYNDIMPNSQVIALNYATVLKSLEKFDKAAEVIDDLLLTNPQNVMAWGLLQQIHQKANQPIKRSIARAEQISLYGNYEKALKELYKAHNLIVDEPITQARIEARIKQFRQMRDELKSLKI